MRTLAERIQAKLDQVHDGRDGKGKRVALGPGDILTFFLRDGTVSAYRGKTQLIFRDGMDSKWLAFSPGDAGSAQQARDIISELLDCQFVCDRKAPKYGFEIWRLVARSAPVD